MPFSEGLAYVCNDEKSGYINAEGEMVIELPIESEGLPFSEGLALAGDGSDMMGYINTKGEMVIRLTGFEPRCFGGFSEGLAVIFQDGKVGYMNTSGEIVIEPQFDFAYSFSEGRAAVLKDGKWGFINTSGEMISQPQWDDIIPFAEGMFAEKSESGFEGWTVGGVDFDEAWAGAFTFSDGLAAVKKDGQWGYINTDGEVVVQPRWTQANSFSGGYAAVQDDTGWYIIDTEGNIVV